MFSVSFITEEMCSISHWTEKLAHHLFTPRFTYSVCYLFVSSCFKVYYGLYFQKAVLEDELVKYKHESLNQITRTCARAHRVSHGNVCVEANVGLCVCVRCCCRDGEDP